MLPWRSRFQPLSKCPFGPIQCSVSSMVPDMRRRGFLGVLGSAVVAWSVAARAQERVRVRKIGVILIYAEADPEGQSRLSALRDRLRKLGWTEGSNIQIDVRWAAG